MAGPVERLIFGLTLIYADRSADEGRQKQMRPLSAYIPTQFSFFRSSACI
jgi:hypothetical protein